MRLSPKKNRERKKEKEKIEKKAEKDSEEDDKVINNNGGVEKAEEDANN